MEQASHPHRVWFTWANALTLVRALLALPAAFCVFNAAWPAAALCFAVAVATDALDGPIARRLGQVSALGGLLDHATDALFVTLMGDQVEDRRTFIASHARDAQGIDV